MITDELDYDPDLDLIKVERSLDLSEDDYIRAGVRPRLPKPKPIAKPFDFDEAVERFRQLPKDWSGWKMTHARMSPVISKQEAHFWLTVMRRRGDNLSHEDVIAELRAMEFSGDVPDSMLRSESESGYWYPQPEVAIVIAALRGLLEFVAVEARTTCQVAWAAAVGFEKYVLPYLTEAETVLLRDECRRNLAPNCKFTPAQVAFVADLGASDVAAREVAQWSSNQPFSYSIRSEGRALKAIIGIRDRSLILEHATRIKVYPVTQDQAKLWLAATEYQGLEFIADAVLNAGKKDLADRLARTFSLVHAPDAVAPLLRICETPSVRIAREWFDANPKHAVAGLIPIAESNSRYAGRALQLLRDLSARGQRHVVDAFMRTQPSVIADRLRGLLPTAVETSGPIPLDETTTPELLAAATPAPGKPRPGDPASSELPSILVQTDVGPRRFSDQQLTDLLAALRKPYMGRSLEYIGAVKMVADSRSLDGFVQTLFNRWIKDDGPSKEKWQMLSLGHLGSDAVALKLTPMIRQWPHQGLFPWAVNGLECLRLMGTDTAMMQVNGIANDVSLRAIRPRAAAFMQQMAEARGLTRDQFEDRIVPSCGLDADGSRVFDFGSRHFRLVLTPELKTKVRDTNGRVAADLPVPNSTDDLNKANAAVDEWKLLKKQVGQVAKVQAGRLEQSMVTGRRWTPDDFYNFLVHHPLMVNLVRLVVWGIYDQADQLKATFRVTEDRTLADNTDFAFALPSDAHIGVVHPLHLSPEQIAAWSDIWSDYDIVPPFPQLLRKTMTLSDDETRTVQLIRFGSVRIDPKKLIFTLDKRGWTRAFPLDGPEFYEHTKPFHGANATAVVRYEPGVVAGFIEEKGDQMITECFWIPGIYTPRQGSWPKHHEGLTWGDIDPIAVSEVLVDLTSILGKKD